jgi:endonuclease/exonuclease/phosphatase family metal-dependent hydrolase
MFNTRQSRRSMLQQSSLAGMAMLGTNVMSLRADEKKDKTLRVIAYNVYECTGWPKERALGKLATQLGQMPARFSHELALYAPDIINFSESPKEPVVQEIAKLLGMNYVMFPSGGKWPGALLCRFEIKNPQNAPLKTERPAKLFSRHWGRAEIRLPSGEALIVHSAHLHPPGVGAAEILDQEIRAMLETMQPDFQAKRSMLLLGDLNHPPKSAVYPLWTDAGWTDTFVTVGKGEGLTNKSDKPAGRIDYVLATGPLAKQVIESRPLFEGAFRVNNEDPEAFALSDHLPQFAVFDLNK